MGTPQSSSSASSQHHVTSPSSPSLPWYLGHCSPDFSSLSPRFFLSFSGSSSASCEQLGILQSSIPISFPSIPNIALGSAALHWGVFCPPKDIWQGWMVSTAWGQGRCSWYLVGERLGMLLNTLQCRTALPSKASPYTLHPNKVLVWVMLGLIRNHIGQCFSHCSMPGNNLGLLVHSDSDLGGTKWAFSERLPGGANVVVQGRLLWTEEPQLISFLCKASITVTITGDLNYVSLVHALFLELHRRWSTTDLASPMCGCGSLPPNQYY